MTKPASPWWHTARRNLATGGLNVCGVAAGEAYRDILPGCRSVLVFASGGRRLWKTFEDHLRTHPEALTTEKHPLDQWAKHLVHQADPTPTSDRIWVHCSAETTHFVDFRPLAEAAGLGHASRLGLLLHPVHGPWMGLRAACFTRDPITPTGPLAGPGPCTDCHAPCTPACPADAVGADGIDIGACATFHVDTGESGPCFRTCHARRSCPVGADSTYSELQMRYHYERRTGRIALAKALGIEPGFPGEGPYWGAWKTQPDPE